MKKSMRSLGDALSSFTRRIDKYGSLPKARVVDAWNKVVGEDIAGHTMGAGIQDGKMLVFVDSHAWANELSVLSEALRQRVNKEIGEDLVTSIRFAVSKNVEVRDMEAEREEEAMRFYDVDRTKPLPLTPLEIDQVEHSAAVIESEELRDAAIRATVADLQRKKGARATKRP